MSLQALRIDTRIGSKERDIVGERGGGGGAVVDPLLLLLLLLLHLFL